jgi:septal ring factor EnvC (AmiA/AmiB activator)
MPETRTPSRPSRDPRLESKPPAALAQLPLGAPSCATVPPAARLASLQAEVERLRTERETDADETAGMLVQIAESDRMRAAAQSQATAAAARATALQTDLDEARRRIDALEVEVAGVREQWSLSEARLGAARETMSTAFGLLESMERRDEMAASIRAKAVRDTLRALQSHDATDRDAKVAPSDEPAAGPESSVEIVGTHDLEWDLDLAGSE